MKIKELKPFEGNVNLEAEVTQIREPREISKEDKVIRVAMATIRDETGEAELSLWDGQIDKVKKGKKVRIENGYVKQWQDRLQVTAGKYGKITAL